MQAIYILIHICIYHPAIMIIANYSCSPYMRASITVLNNLYLGQRPQQKVILSLWSGTRTLHQTPLFENVVYCGTNLCRRLHHSDTSILQCTYFVLCSSFSPCYYSCELQERKLYTWSPNIGLNLRTAISPYFQYQSTLNVNISDFTW